MFTNNIEYSISSLENDEAKDFIMGKKLHIYNASCSCPGNNIKINQVGIIKDCVKDNNNEYFYLLVNEENPNGIQVTTRSNFIKFMIIDEEKTE